MLTAERKAALMARARTAIMLVVGLVALVAFLVFGPLGLGPDAVVGSSTENA